MDILCPSLGFKDLLAELQQAPAFSKLNRGPHAWPGKFRSVIFLSSLAHGVEIRLRRVAVGFLTTEPSHRQGQFPKSKISHFRLQKYPRTGGDHPPKIYDFTFPSP